MSLLTTTEDDKELNSIFELSPSLLQISSNEEAVVGNDDFSENEVQVGNTSFATGEENSVVESVNDSNDAEDVSDNNFTGNENTSDTESYEYQTTGRSRKRKRNNTEWSRNIRKRRRQSGKEYKNQEGKVMRARKVKTKKDCSGLCKFKCAKMFSQAERQKIFNEFWKLPDNEKSVFYIRTTEYSVKQRTRTPSKESRRKYSYKYFFFKGTQKVRVCKEFYLQTLDISQRRIEWLYKKKVDKQDFFSDQRGNHVKKQIPDPATEYIKRHINSFPRIPSHYCRQHSNKEYLESTLSLTKMYSVYVEKCETEHIHAERICTYRRVFNENFNIEFQKPKKDRCDICEEYKIRSKSNTHSSDFEEKYQKHLTDKTETQLERDTDRKKKQEIVVCFDLENVITCPRANVSNFFYKRKLNVFNLTAHCSVNKTAYNAVWSEISAGRGGNEIASALCVILHKITEDFPEIQKLTLWSDSCIPQNRNSIMTLALKSFLRDHPTIERIVQKFCTPGHSSIQEVDNINSHIEKGLKVAEVYSPISLIRV